MDPTLISLAALGMSSLSVCFTAYFAFHDRPRVKTKSSFQANWEGYEPQVLISIINMGRRPIVIRKWTGSDRKGSTVGSYLERPDGLTLSERQRFDLRLRKQDLVCMTPGDDVEIWDVYFEDTLDRRIKVKGAVKSLRKLWDA